MIYAVLVANIFWPWGIAQEFTSEELGIGVVAIAAKLTALAVVLVVWETVLAKMRIFMVTEFLSTAILARVNDA